MLYGRAFAEVGALLVDLFTGSFAEPPELIVLNLDATGDMPHGHQEARFFRCNYGQDCYWPPYIVCGAHIRVPMSS